MKKSLLFSVLTLVIAVSFMSCASLPKKVKPGDTLVIGRVEVKTSGYENFMDVEFNGIFHDGIELTIRDQITGKERTVLPNKDGCFYITGLKAHGTYGISKLKLTRHGISGAYSWLEFEIPNPKVIIPYDNMVVNTGCLYIYFDYTAGQVSWETKNHFYVNQFFQELEEDSEWFEKKMYNQR